MDFDTALRMSSAFGGGMGRLREVCGAVSSMFLIVGIKYGYADARDSDAKAELYRKVQLLAERFRDENGTIICRELLGLAPGPDRPVPEARTEKYYASRPCVELVGCAAGLIEEFIVEEDNRLRSPEAAAAQ